MNKNKKTIRKVVMLASKDMANANKIMSELGVDGFPTLVRILLNLYSKGL